jgi:PPP family 3-phenylpropionic acid transporter
MNTKLSLMQGLYWAANCIAFSFLVPLFRTWGYSDFEIGVLTMLMALSSTIAQPLWGMYCDKQGHLKAVFISQMLLGSLFIFFLPLGEHHWLSAALIVICLSAAIQPMANLVDVWTIKLINEGEHVNYSWTRSFGSIFFAVGAVIFGVMLDDLGDWIRIPIFVGLTILLVLLAINLRKPAQPIRMKVNAESQLQSIRLLLKNKQYVGLVLSVFLLNVGGCVSIVFYPLLISDLGGNNSDLGLGWFVMAMSEVPVFMLFGWLLRKVAKVNVLLIVGMSFYGIKTALIAIAPNVAWAIGLQSLEALSFALYLPAVIYYINEIVDRKALVTAQMLLASVYGGLGPIAGNFLGGLLSEHYGVSTMMLLMSTFSFLGTALFMILEWRRRVYSHASLT